MLSTHQVRPLLMGWSLGSRVKAPSCGKWTCVSVLWTGPLAPAEDRPQGRGNKGLTQLNDCLVESPQNPGCSEANGPVPISAISCKCAAAREVTATQRGGSHVYDAFTAGESLIHISLPSRALPVASTFQPERGSHNVTGNGLLKVWNTSRAHTAFGLMPPWSVRDQVGGSVPHRLRRGPAHRFACSQVAQRS